MHLPEIFRQRRSVYALRPESPLSEDEVRRLVADTLQTLPSAFNSQPVRVALLFGEAHATLWRRTLETLLSQLPEGKRGPTQAKVARFARAYGTLLWYCDDTVTEALARDFPLYAEHFPAWAEQAEGIAQFAVWCALRDRGLGASLQHYNPLIDATVAEAFPVPPHWRPVAQMPFGAIDSVDPPLPRLPEAEVLRVFRQSHGAS